MSRQGWERQPPRALLQERLVSTGTAMTDVAERRKRGQEKAGGWGETIRTVVYAVLIALVVRTFAIEPFNIPSGSMIPTLLVGDYLFVSKYSYGYSKHSFPFSMGMFPGRIFGSPPERGDVAVFKYPGDQGQGVNRTDYIKRIVGMPGDRIQVTNGVLHINGQAVERLRIGDYVKGANGHYQKGTLYKETLPNGRSYTVLEYTDNGMADNTPEFLVPAGNYFVMGDNRDDSLDSRTRLMLRDFAGLDARSRPARLVRAGREPGRPRRVHLLLARSVGRRLAGAVEMANSDPLQPLLPGHPLKDGPLNPGDVDFASLSDRLGHSFKRAELAVEALTHRGTLDKRPDLKAAFPHGNERLEFLGDRVLSLAMADLLLRRFPHEREGQLARRHAALVSARTLGEIAEAIGAARPSHRLSRRAQGHARHPGRHARGAAGRDLRRCRLRGGGGRRRAPVGRAAGQPASRAAAAQDAAAGMGAGPRAGAAVLQAGRPRRHRARAGVPGRGEGRQAAAGAGPRADQARRRERRGDPDARTD